MNFRNPFKITKSSCKIFGFNLILGKMRFTDEQNDCNRLLLVCYTYGTFQIQRYFRKFASVKRLVKKFTKMRCTLTAEELLKANNYSIRADPPPSFSKKNI